MYRFNNLLEVGFISTLIAVMSESFISIHVSYSILVLLVCIDTIIGIIYARKMQRFSSRGLKKIVNKIFTYSISIITIRLLEIIIVEIYSTSFLTNTIIAFLALTEVVSIMENLTLLGVPISTRILSIVLETLKIGQISKETKEDTSDYTKEIDDIINYQLPEFVGFKEMRKLNEIQFVVWKDIVKQIDMSFNTEKMLSNEYVYYKTISLIELGLKDMKIRWQEEDISFEYIISFSRLLRRMLDKLKIKINDISYSSDNILVKKQKLIESIITMLYKYVLEAQKQLIE